MKPEVCSSHGDAASASPGTRGGAAKRAGAPRSAARMIDGRAEDRHVWAIAALAVPLLFCAIVGLGVFLMFHRNMGYFKPAPSGSSAPLRTPVAAAASGESAPG